MAGLKDVIERIYIPRKCLLPAEEYDILTLDGSRPDFVRGSIWCMPCHGVASQGFSGHVGLLQPLKSLSHARGERNHSTFLKYRCALMNYMNPKDGKGASPFREGLTP